jgi:hypothetical protein
MLEIADTARSAQKRSAALESPTEYAATTEAGATAVRGGVFAP